MRSDGGHQQLPRDVEIQVLEGRGGDEVPPPGQEAGRLWPADGLPPAERDKIGAEGHEAAEVVGRRQLARRVDEDGYAPAMRDLDDLGQRRSRAGRGHVEHRSRALADGLIDLPSLGVSDPGPGEAVR